MKAVLISIQPKWCELIASGKKTIELRKTKPNLKTPFKVYIYETNWRNNTYWKQRHKGKLGKVIGEFICDRVSGGAGEYAVYHTAGTCLTPTEIADYIGDKYAYYWHISDLVIYDKPRSFDEFYAEGDCDCSNCTNCRWFSLTQSGEADCDLGVNFKPITRPPQSWCYVESEVVEVRHGKWLLEKEPNGKPYCFHCSVCDDEFRRIDIKVKTPYCPQCGAKMDGERREE